MPDSIRRTIEVSKETDLSLRSFLGAQGMKKGGISRLVAADLIFVGASLPFTASLG
jgi:hypothetical protein